MNLDTLVSFMTGGQATLMARVGVLLVPLYRGCFVVGAASQSVLTLLAQGPVPLDRIVAELCPDGDGEEGLEAWLDFGVHLGEFERGPGGYSLRGMLSRRLADARSDAVAALLEEVVTLHARLLLQTPALVRQGRRFTLDDQDGRLIARSSRMLEPFVFEAVDAAVPTAGPLRLLEIGCGSGTYIRRAVERNPALTALGVELQPAVAEAARANLRAWGVDANVTIDAADIRALTPDASFDLATLHNNIYYFPITARVELLKHVRGFLRAGGGLLLTTGCRGGSLLMEALNLWSATTEGCGSLPTPEELTGQLRAAGFTDVTARRLIPGESYYSFTAQRAASS